MEPASSSTAAAIITEDENQGEEEVAIPEPEPEEEEEEEKVETEEDVLVNKAQEFMTKIITFQLNPSPKLIHALASMLETEESRYVEESGDSSPSNGRASHNIGRLGNLVRYPHVFEDDVVENIKKWVMDDNVRLSVDEYKEKHEHCGDQPTDSEMLKTYGTGLLAVCLAGGGQVVEDVLTSGLSAKLMRYLRTRVLGETSTNQKEVSYLAEGKNTAGATCIRGREDNRGRFRQALDATHLGDEVLLDDRSIERDRDKRISLKQVHGEEQLDDDLSEGGGICEVDEDGVELIEEEIRHNRESRDGKAKFSERYGTSIRDEDADENTRDDPSRRRANRWSRLRGKGRSIEGALENERALTSPVSGIKLGQGRSIRERNVLRNTEMRGAADPKKQSSKNDADSIHMGREDNDDRFLECKVGTKDISDLVKKATRAAEAEAMAANAPAEAIKAAGDAAAELVNTAALEALKTTNDEEAAVLAASEAASTVVDAANATEVSRHVKII
ncbi:hypothetical protein IFM89_009867 [Coptis chinensis]|uniref:Uncharacterized protein n=1 Tax=Coptis chinensis TaxID=261450 RepID=A0A835M2N5_9MAGN|nr:hypothetical protein IFM89_009867 [Coptis chinensis]